MLYERQRKNNSGESEERIRRMDDTIRITFHTASCLIRYLPIFIKKIIAKIGILTSTYVYIPAEAVHLPFQ